MAETRTPRELDTRETTARFVYKPASILPDPTPQAGWTFRWVATAVLGKADPTNVSKKLRDGWVPVKAKDHPELMLGESETGNVEIGGLMLCKMPTERADAIGHYYQQQSKDQIESVDNSFMRQNDPRMPLFADRKSTTSRGGAGSIK